MLSNDEFITFNAKNFVFVCYMSMLSSINFTGLTKNLSRQPYDKLPAMQKVVDSSGSSIAGKLPRDITKEIIKNHPNPKLAIKELYSDFANCANILQGIFLETAESVDDFEVFTIKTGNVDKPL